MIFILLVYLSGVVLLVHAVDRRLHSGQRVRESEFFQRETGLLV